MHLFVLYYSISGVFRFVFSHVQRDKFKGTYLYFSIYISWHYTLVPSYTRLAASYIDLLYIYNFSLGHYYSLSLSLSLYIYIYIYIYTR